MTNVMTRTLKLVQGQETCDVNVKIFWPNEDENSWSCDWEIIWPDRLRKNSGRGIDSIQALLSALQMIGSELNCSAENRSKRLSWGEDWSGLGFPVPNGIRDMLAGDDSKYL